MARSLTTDMQTELRREVVQPVFFVSMQFPDAGNFNLWTGRGDFYFKGETYTGTGNLLGIDKLEEAADLRAVGVTFTLTGVPAAFRSLALNASSNMQGGKVSVWLGLLWNYNELVAEPYRWDFRMDTMTISDTGSSCTIALDAESVLIDLERPRVRYYTPEDLKLDYPTDTFLNYVASLQDKTIRWGA